MRLDKFLKVSRLIKRRTLAKEVSDQGKIEVNDRIAKPGHVVKVGDVLTLHFGSRVIKARILRLEQSSRREEAPEMYEIVDEFKVL
ncbi:MAG: RNA-binding S4 domain-containing protein [Thermaerobacter sp.]|nr:RNA-binding S4 domain-containing protein [Thermaerobacter sp.]MBS4055530.1 RNA-binding S4 domain-containing protein [Thermaerobacter sp.]